MGKNCEYIIHWKIMNFSYLWHEKGDRLNSPLFSLNGLDETKWKLRLYPRGDTSGNYIACFLRREVDSSSIEYIGLEFELSLQSQDSLSLYQERFLFTESFMIDQAWGKHEMNKREDVFGAEKAKFLEDDTLTAYCRLRKCNELNVETVNLCARTIVKVEKGAFVWNIDQFSRLEPLQRRTLALRFNSEEHVATLELFLSGRCFEEVINIDISFHDPAIKYFTLKSFLLDGMGEELDCGHYEFVAEDLTEGTTFTLLITKKKLMEKKDIFLSKDELSLHCECAFTTGIIFEGIEKIHVGAPSVETKDRFGDGSETCSSDGLKRALKSIYDEGLFSDMELRTIHESFSVHRNILAARSPVFKAIFKDSSQEFIHIPDLDYDVVRQMILYLYTDSLGDLNWENALKLHIAADKYEIATLKKKCASLVKEKLRTDNVCEILLLVDMFHGKDLKRDVQDYVLKHDREIFNSKDWKSLMETNSKLAAETMFLKYFKE
ncbi:TD and POZ domain-containing protein 1-like [Nephila pilipes]|uniref:TD and POZ domain-containing protein 1-like n=1 Tax=Nephila pilipes TaxID=299642 RepID=A0A8X6MVE6_NEPPI|nr:TD and POZ domain-containing protein 1-like [Nephila pilipes]